MRRAHSLVLCAAATSIAAPATVLAQEYTLDDWMTITAVGSFVWAPDGGHLYFTSDAAPNGTDAIYRVAAGGGEPELLSQATDGERPESTQELTISATEAPRVFEAQLIRAPVSDWTLLAVDRFGASGRAWTAGRTPARVRSEFGRGPDEIPQEYFRRSPINFVEHVEVPQLLIQGLRDGSVPPRQSQVWAQRMEELGKGDLLQYVELADEDHGLTRYRSTIRERIELMERFLGEHLQIPDLAAGTGSGRGSGSGGT